MIIAGWDTETWPIYPGMISPRMVCLSSCLEASTPSLYSREGGLCWLELLLRRKDVFLVAHNFSFDAVVSAAEDPRFLRLIMDAVDEGRMRCTFVRQCLLDVAAGESDFRHANPKTWDFRAKGPLGVTKADKSLGALGLLYFGEVWEKGADTWQLRYGELDGLSFNEWPKDAVDYSKEDAIRPVRVFEAQRKRAEELRVKPEMEGVWESSPGEIPDELPQTRAALWLQLMAAWGLRTDPIAVAKLKAEHEAEQTRVRLALQPTGVIREDGSRDMKVIKARVISAYARVGKEPQTTAKGDISTSSETLCDSGDPDLILLGESLSNAATIGTWLPWLEQGTKTPICVGYNPILDTGRASARKPNIMNPPRKGGIRSTFIPRQGWVYSFCDYDTAELRALAQVCIWLLGWSDLATALREGIDPHLSLAAEILGINYEEALRRYEEGDKEVADIRQICKVANFGYPGGLGPDKFVAYAHAYDPKLKNMVDLQTSKQLRSAWFKRWREMRPYFECVNQAVGQTGSGAVQQFWSKRVRGDVGFTQCANGTFQGLVADGAKRAGWALARECYLGNWMYSRQAGEDGELSPLLGSRPVLFMHDEFGLEIPYNDPIAAARASERQAYVQRMAMQEVIPDVPIKCGAVLTKRWHKGAKAVFVDGIKVPSKPVDVDGKIKWVADV